MPDSPRRARARGWAWACLALFGTEAEGVDARGEANEEAPNDSE